MNPYSTLILEAGIEENPIKVDTILCIIFADLALALVIFCCCPTHWIFKDDEDDEDKDGCLKNTKN
jgi:hypothetical protein